jgi:hypothetical protein
MQRYPFHVVLYKADHSMISMDALSTTDIEEIKNYCYDPINTILVKGQNQHFMQFCYHGPLGQWIFKGTAGTLCLYELYSPYGDIPYNMIYTSIYYEHKFLTRDLLPSQYLHQTSFQSNLWDQLKWVDTTIPHFDLVQFHYDELENTFHVFRKFNAVKVKSIPPPNAGYLVNVLELPMSLKKTIAPICPKCNISWVYRNKCLGSYLEYTLPGGEIILQSVSCSHVSTSIQPDYNSTTLWEKGRFSTKRRRKKYHSVHHAREILIQCHGNQRTEVDGSILRDIQNFLFLSNLLPTKDNILYAMHTLQRYYPGRYSPWYGDVMKIQLILEANIDKPPEYFITDDWFNNPIGIVENPIEYGHMRALEDIYKQATLSFHRCPLRGDRKNFLRAKMLLYHCCSIAAVVFKNPIYLIYQHTHFSESDGSPPSLKDDTRQNEYLKIIQWILHDCGWGHIQL